MVFGSFWIKVNLPTILIIPMPMIIMWWWWSNFHVVLLIFLVCYVNDLSIKGYKMSLYQTLFLTWIHVSNINVSKLAELWTILWLVVSVVAFSSRYGIDVFFFILVQIWDWWQKDIFCGATWTRFHFCNVWKTSFIYIYCCNYFVNNLLQWF